MARLSSSKSSWSTPFVVFFTLFLLIVSLSAIGALKHIDTDSPDVRSETETTDQQPTPNPVKTESINDLFRNFSNDLGRLRAAYDLIGDADEAKLIELFDQVIHRKYSQEEGSNKSELISLISTRLAGMNLDKTVSLYESQPAEVAKHMLYGVMHAWASEDFDEAVKFARKQDESIRSVALRGIVDASPSVSSSTLMQLSEELGDVAYVERALANRQLEMDLADPDQAWSNLLDDPTINLSKNFYRVKLVANAVIDKHGTTEIDDLLGSIASPKLNFELKKSILSNVTLNDPETAFNMALATPNDVFGTMLTAVINTWATTDPQSALERVRALEPSVVRDRLEQKVVSSWVQINSEQFVDSLDDIPVELHDTARLSLVGQLSKDSIDDALDVLLDIQDVKTQEEAAITIVDVWMDSNPEEAFEWALSSAQNDPYRDQLVNSFLTSLSKKDADKAFDLALSQSIIEERGVGLEFVVLDAIAHTKTELAFSLLDRVRPGNTLLAASETVATGLIYDSRTDEALVLGKQLTEKDQESFYNNIAFDIVTQEPPKRIVELISALPVREARTTMAEHALRFHSFSDKPLYSADEIEKLMQHVTSDYAQRFRLRQHR
ncbi:MAG: hypothetical protein F4077_11005 [Gammaproteobacteria bacterium]|nr:hypothetical protein [Gammaproteobacteria bacterium]MYI78254.1 hypothetical protein [Gammaproteobacteria bacterium]